jgi:hypothetical protein
VVLAYSEISPNVEVITRETVDGGAA